VQRCESCGSGNVVPIHSGRLMDPLQPAAVGLAAVFDPELPAFQCNSCGHAWRGVMHSLLPLEVESILDTSLEMLGAHLAAQQYGIDRYAAASISYGGGLSGRDAAPDAYVSLLEARTQILERNESFLRDAAAMVEKLKEAWIRAHRMRLVTRLANISDESVMAYARATGLPQEEARQTLLTMKGRLRGRVIRAAMTQAGCRSGYLHDPIEDEPSLRDAFVQAREEAQTNLSARGVLQDIGYCHVFWAEQATVLSNRFGIIWYSPARMNPGTLFD
jgi:hypothetical protein